MSDTETQNENKISYCFNCETKILDNQKKSCPNCGIILNPNSYMKWRYSFLSCLCLLCIIPLLIAIVISFYFK
jgi:predicted RNA-binding Zn-ribbon protein involved in translation (DUF1610 family)